MPIVNNFVQYLVDQYKIFADRLFVYYTTEIFNHYSDSVKQL